MSKKGQVGVFAAVGVVIVILVALFFFLRNEYGIFISPTSFLSDKSKPIEDNLRNCVNDAVTNSLNLFGKQGGDFNPSQYKFYQSMNVKYFCTNIPGEDKCLNVMPTIGQVVQEFNNKIQVDARNCVDKDLVKSSLGYDVEAGELTTTTNAAGSTLTVRSDYDVKIIKGETQSTVRGVTLSYDVPLEELYAVAVDIVNSEANTGFFEQLLYMVNERGQYIINVDKPYPDKIYKVNKKDSDFEFWFAVEGERNI